MDLTLFPGAIASVKTGLTLDAYPHPPCAGERLRSGRTLIIFTRVALLGIMQNLLAHYSAMSRYNTWINRKLYALAADVPNQDRNRDLGAFFGSLHATLKHIVVADRIWLSRFGVEENRSTTDGYSSEFEALRAERETTDVAIENYVARLKPDALDSSLAYRNSRGDAFLHPLWFALTHFFNHQTHHRGQATTLFMQLNIDPGVTDIICFLRGDFS